MDELWEVLTLLQTQKVSKPMPVVLYGEDHWKKLINFDMLVENLMIDEKDLALLYFSNTPDDAFHYLSHELHERFLK